MWNEKDISGGCCYYASPDYGVATDIVCAFDRVATDTFEATSSV